MSRAISISPRELSISKGVGNPRLRPRGASNSALVRNFLYIGPAAGIFGTTSGGVFDYAGFYADVTWGRFVSTPLGAVGFYRRGSDENLGGTFQFRISASLAYQLDSGSRLGTQFAHISNAGLHKSNPGDNEVLATYSLPLPF
jgi:lipid A 3-O-deacylase